MSLMTSFLLKWSRGIAVTMPVGHFCRRWTPPLHYAKVKHIHFWVTSGLMCSLTQKDVAPETKILFEDWMPHYGAQVAFMSWLDGGRARHVSLD